VCLTKEAAHLVKFKIFSGLDRDQVWAEAIESEVNSSSTAINLIGPVHTGVKGPDMLFGYLLK
jgi:hypothetical protein